MLNIFKRKNQMHPNQFGKIHVIWHRKIKIYRFLPIYARFSRKISKKFMD